MPLAVGLTIAAVMVVSVGVGELQRVQYQSRLQRPAINRLRTIHERLSEDHQRVVIMAPETLFWPRPDRSVFPNPDRSFSIAPGHDERGHMLGERRIVLGRIHMGRRHASVVAVFPAGRVHVYLESDRRLDLENVRSRSQIEFTRFPGESWSSVRADGLPFSRRTMFRWSARSGSRTLYAFDPEDASVARLEIARNERFRPVTPFGDDVPTLLRTSRIDDRNVLTVLTDAARYELDPGGQFVRHPRRQLTTAEAEEIQAELDEFDADTVLRVFLENDDPLALRLAVKREDSVVTSMNLDPHPVSKRIVQTCVALRAPLFGALSVLSPKLFWPLDPILHTGKYLWLFLVGVGLALLLAFAAVKRLRDAGAPPGVRRLWFVLIAIGGLGAFSAYALLESRRMHRGVRTVPQADVPPLRIYTPSVQSA